MTFLDQTRAGHVTSKSSVFAIFGILQTFNNRLGVAREVHSIVNIVNRINSGSNR